MTLPLYIVGAIVAVVVFLLGFGLGMVHGWLLALDFIDLDKP